MFVLGVIVGALIVLTAFCAAVPGYNEVIRTEEREKLYRALKNLPPFTVSCFTFRRESARIAPKGGMGYV